MIRHIAIALALFGSYCTGGVLHAQTGLYDLGSVREVRLYFAEPDWNDLLDTLYLAGDERLQGDLIIDGTSIPDVGVRYKGFSSYSSSREKNPFNIKLDHVHAGQNYQGYEKLKLSNVIQDPSFLREVLSYEIVRKYMPASQANYANVYVNDILIGLYANVEDVSKEFVDSHFGSRGNPFVKGNPTTVDLNGENSNLSNSPGTDIADYYDLYSLESDEGWDELYTLIDVLNNDPENVEEILNVDRTLWMHAFNYALINFDSYVGYAQNYYLYMDDNARWNPILWDMNMSFASFRLTDASTHWNGFSIAQAITIDPLEHLNSVSVQPRPLMRNLFQNPTYQRMYLAHMRTIVDENFADHSYYSRAEGLRDIIAPYVLADTNKFYSYQAFLDNLDETFVDLIDYPGIAELIDQRTVYLYDYPGFTNQPVVSDVAHFPVEIAVGEEVAITATIVGSDSAFLAYRTSENGLFEHIELKDDGLNADGSAGDGVFGTLLTASSSLIQFYIYAENATAGVFEPVRAANEFHSIFTQINPGDLVINEFMALNGGTVVDENGDPDDWIELYNRSTFALSTAGLYVSDDASDPTKWAMPTRVVQPNEYLIIWADGQPDQGDDHADFKLEATGETVMLSYADSTVIDQVNFGNQYEISSTGRFPNGSGVFRELYPTFNAWNSQEGIDDLDRFLRLFPNPTNGDITLILDEDDPYEMVIFSPDGKRITPDFALIGDHAVRIGTLGLTPGAYVLEVRTSNRTSHQTFILSE
ncbi:MAG: CotH kinase family protein [Flavobacteriales bacterium]|nr:CotH kinase family protein [Flavobacteriales bacterium]MBK6946216.1 CotH kinase family protein [Flavobacteriales bacterium]MBK9537043.1 CotH kinase family protein [Flavobacteriales bacterium]MBP9139727.1 CotH kinase family protein [Flavobacteriales bacterium]HQV52407.1 CotH kinase family protein [Flavobacteriales bacterium]